MSATRRLAAALLVGRCAMTLATMPNPDTRADWSNHDGGSYQASFGTLVDPTPNKLGQLGLQRSLDLDGEQSLEAASLAGRKRPA